MGPKSKQIWHFDRFVFTEATSELTRDGNPVNIEPQSVRLLEYLIRNRDLVVSREDLVEHIWDGRFVSDWAVSAAVKALRTTLGDTGRAKRIVRTIHSRGFRFVASIDAEQTSEVASLVTGPVILVRRFRSPDGSKEDGYLVEGLTEDLITDLSRYGNLRVLSYNASRALGDDALPKSIGVTNLVEGSVRRLGDTIRINVAIVEADGDQQIWAERFDLETASLLAAQDRIGRRVAETLSPGAALPVTGRVGTRNSEAYDHYLKGRYAYFRYEPSAFVEALEHFASAVEIDPNFADALAQQAYCRTTLYVFGLPGADKTLDAAEAMARKAIDLDDRSPLGHARLGWVLGYRGRPEKTIAAFENALACSARNAEVYYAYGETMNRLAQPERARSLLATAFDSDMFFPPSWEFAQGHTSLLLHEHDAAVAHFRSVLARVERFIPARVQLARALWEMGDALAAADEVATIKSYAPKYGLGHAKRMFPYPDDKEFVRLVNGLAGAGMT